MIIYFVSGIIAGVSASSYFIGKELFAFYRKSSIQEKQLDRMRKLNHQLSLKNSLALTKNQHTYVKENADLLVQ